MGNRLKVKWHLCSWYVNRPTLSTINSPKTCWTFGIEGEALVFGMIIMRFNLHIWKPASVEGFFFFFCYCCQYWYWMVYGSRGSQNSDKFHVLWVCFNYQLNNDSFLLHVYIYIGKASANVVKPLKQALIFLILWFNTTAIKCILAKIVQLSILKI